MKRRFKFLSLLCGWMIAATLPTAAAGEEYDLNIESIATVGDAYDFTASTSSSERSLSRIDGDLFDESVVMSTTELAGQVEFLAVNDDGGVMRLAFRLDSAAVEVDGEVLEVDRSRRLVLDLSGDESDLTYEDGEAVAPELRGRLLETLQQSGGSTDGDGGDDDAMLRSMGIDVPRTPGTRWDFDYETFFNAFGEEGFPFEFDPAKTESDVHFAEVNRALYGEDVAVLAFSVDSTDFAFVDPQMPDLFKTTASDMHTDAEIHQALDPHSFVGRQAFAMSMSFAAEGDMTEQGQTIHLEIEVEVNMHQSITLTRPE